MDFRPGDMEPPPHAARADELQEAVLACGLDFATKRDVHYAKTCRCRNTMISPSGLRLVSGFSAAPRTQRCTCARRRSTGLPAGVEVVLADPVAQGLV